MIDYVINFFLIFSDYFFPLTIALVISLVICKYLKEHYIKEEQEPNAETVGKVRSLLIKLYFFALLFFALLCMGNSSITYKNKVDVTQEERMQQERYQEELRQESAKPKQDIYKKPRHTVEEREERFEDMMEY